ncbi:hypothetical protein LOTGIDRAFT_175010 [Lottia gigantea]|uniref:Uncharacterized protein n=1 Tax=Lottia gigantea TaxID=225164 RepID=V4C371_LOTGI|nr:hypothetical protein LOTGIDRAFT_175010 [Lottia gigantea]ESO95954.1 hypothetical protein LOTGIDRAFT_175010 [Lottia gigantea]
MPWPFRLIGVLRLTTSHTRDNKTKSISSHSSHIHHQICDPPTYGSSVSHNHDKPITDEAPIQNLHVNPEISTENVRCTHGTGRLSIISTTSITDYNVHRPPPENSRTRKRSLRHYACVVFTTILALGIPTFIVLMTSGAISGLQHHTANELKNETKRSTFPMSNSAGVVRRRREASMKATQKDLVHPNNDVEISNQAKSTYDLKQVLREYDTSVNERRKFNSQLRQKRYHDMMYMINFTRMHSGLHDHKNFIKKLIETIMKNIKN